MPVLTGTASADSLSAVDGSSEDWTISGLEGDDSLTGMNGNDVLYGGSGWDLLTDQSGGNDQLFGEGDQDSLSVYRYENHGASSVLLDGGGDNDVLTYFGARFVDHVSLIGGDGEDHISIFRGGAVTIDGGAGDDRVILSFLGAVTRVTLGAGADVLSLGQVFGGFTPAGSIIVTDLQAEDRAELLGFLSSALQGWDPAANPFASQHLRVVQQGEDSILQVDVDAAAGAGAWFELIRFQNVQISALTQFNLGGFLADGSAPGTTTITGTDGHEVLWGGMDADLIQGLGGYDQIFGGAGNDVIEGGGGRDWLDGQLGNDVLYGGDESDTLLDEFGGNDSLYGEAGNDRLTVIRNDGSVASTVLLDGGIGGDVIDFASSSSFSHNVTLAGGEGNDDIYVTGGGTVSIQGGAGNDHVQLSEIGGNYTISLGAGYDQLYLSPFRWEGNPAAHILVTDFTAGTDAEADVLFIRDYLQAVLQSWDPAANPFTTGHLMLASGDAGAVLLIDRDGGGNGFVPFIRLLNLAVSSITAHNLAGWAPVAGGRVGTEGADILSGIGPELMIGFGGDDTFYVDSTDDVLVEAAGEGARDAVFASASYALGAGTHVEILSTSSWASKGAMNLTGNSFSQEIYGNAGANILSGGGGADYMVGFGGNDAYHVDSLDDVIVEGAAEGSRDAVFASSSYALAAGAYAEVLSTYAWSSAVAINLTGNSLAQEIYGNAGANILHGGGGTDYLVGFGGNDTYQVDSMDDVIVESAGEGARDAAFASSNYALSVGAYVEVLSTDAWSSAASINLTGNTFAQEIYGNAGANVLNGGGGADYLVGFGGNDTYHVDSLDDVIIEDAGEGARDVAYAAGSFALSSSADVEVISTDDWSSTAAINLAGNSLSQELYGNAGNNVLNGGDGNDQLYGFAGNDTLVGGWGSDVLSGGSGADIFRFTNLEAGDLVTDFQSGTDKIDLGSLLSAQNFHFIGSNAFTGQAGQGRFSDGVFQLDGNGDGVVDFAVVVQGSKLTATDFMFG